MSAFFDYIYPCNGNRRNEKGDTGAGRNKQNERVCQNQRESIHGPYCGMIVIVGIHEFRPVVLLAQGGYMVEVRMHRCRVIMIGSAGMDVLKGR